MAIERVRPCTAAFDALYTAIPWSQTRPEIEPTLTITPPSGWSLIWRTAARHTLNTPLTFTPITYSKSSSVVSATVFSTCTPALFTTTSTRPNASTPAAIRASA